MDAERIREMREALRARIGEAGLRRTAREVGMSPTAIASFVAGRSRPYRRTWGLLAAWRAGLEERPPALEPLETRRVLLDLTRHLPHERRFEVVLEMEKMLRALPLPAAPADTGTPPIPLPCEEERAEAA
ncbi:MAG TPA: hypothetical protein VFQ39_15765 [Longimicrobium sp.]|nr:hypothetical protein [Longimicrobium sp.]